MRESNCHVVGSMGGETRPSRGYKEILLINRTDEIRIVKVRNRYMCDRDRVEAMDFQLWHFHYDVDVCICM